MEKVARVRAHTAVDRFGSPFAPYSLLRKKVLADALNVSEWTIDRWVKTQQFPSPFYATAESPATWFWRDIEAWIAKRKRSRRPRPAPRGQLRGRDQLEEKDQKEPRAGDAGSRTSVTEGINALMGKEHRHDKYKQSRPR
jgi:predicted DNA-binding transcriptional regulator AlpA